jgi:hypothetical protein
MANLKPIAFMENIKKASNFAVQKNLKVRYLTYLNIGGKIILKPDKRHSVRRNGLLNWAMIPSNDRYLWKRNISVKRRTVNLSKNALYQCIN